MDRHRSRSASTDVSGIQDVSESQWEQVVSSKSDPVRVSSSSRPLSGVVEVEGESEGEDRDIDDHLGARPSMGKQEGSSSKRRKIGMCQSADLDPTDMTQGRQLIHRYAKQASIEVPLDIPSCFTQATDFSPIYPSTTSAPPDRPDYATLVPSFCQYQWGNGRIRQFDD